ncbi:MAG: hypothetical protein H0W64_02550 [Gammaproteobacteria bacterium]|nr:hypothetical protein [Gammaproteobacteria bacterium]
MRKIQLCATALMSLFTASVAFASSDMLSNYYSSQRPQATAAIKASLHPPTDITVINASTSHIYAVVPNSPINDLINPGFNDHIYNTNPNVWSTLLVLQDPYRGTFFNANVCRLAIVTVYGTPGSYRINTDTDLCN